MTSSRVKDQAASIRHRLRNLAAERQEESGFVLTRYAVQRLLHRLSWSEFRDRFLLKGATLFAVWSDQPHRPTRDKCSCARTVPPSRTRCVMHRRRGATKREAINREPLWEGLQPRFSLREGLQPKRGAAKPQCHSDGKNHKDPG